MKTLQAANMPGDISSSPSIPRTKCELRHPRNTHTNPRKHDHASASDTCRTHKQTCNFPSENLHTRDSCACTYSSDTSYIKIHACIKYHASHTGLGLLVGPALDQQTHAVRVTILSGTEQRRVSALNLIERSRKKKQREWLHARSTSRDFNRVLFSHAHMHQRHQSSLTRSLKHVRTKP